MFLDEARTTLQLGTGGIKRSRSDPSLQCYSMLQHFVILQICVIEATVLPPLHILTEGAGFFSEATLDTWGDGSCARLSEPTCKLQQLKKQLSFKIPKDDLKDGLVSYPHWRCHSDLCSYHSLGQNAATHLIAIFVTNDYMHMQTCMQTCPLGFTHWTVMKIFDSF